MNDKKLQEMVLPIVDTLFMSLVVNMGKERPITGSKKIEVPLVEAQKIQREVKIVDSLIDKMNAITGVVAHVGGDLYLSVLNNHHKKYLIVMVLDGSKLNLKKRKKKLFPTTWSRKGYYATIVDGIVRTFGISTVGDKNWEEYPKGNGLVIEYLDKRKEGMGSFAAARESLKEKGVDSANLDSI